MSPRYARESSEGTDNKGLKIGIISGIVSSLIVIIFIQPILSLLWQAIVTVGGSVHQGYVDRIYRNASVLGPDTYGRLTLFVLILLVLFAGMAWTVHQMKSHVISDNPPRSLKAVRAISWLMVVMAFLVIFGRLAVLEGTRVIAASFTQRLTVLAPAISDIEYKTLMARWASMRGKADYDALVIAMDKRASELGVTLPPVRKP